MTLASDRDRLLADGSLRGRAFADAWRGAVDPWLVDRFTAATEGSPERGDLALVAVGGYGRGDLAPASDLDLLLLYRGKNPPGEVAEKIWYPIWDEGLKLGHSVRTVKEALDLSSEDLDTATSLLTIRHLAGDEELTAEMGSAAAAQWTKRSKRFLAMLRDSVAARQTQQGEVAFLLEPDLKEGRGGLRDVHALRWAQAARPVLEEGDAEALADAERVLFEARVEFHRATGRAGDRLTLQDQDAVGDALGMSADELMAGVATAARNVAWIADETWDRVGTSLATSISLLGWRSRERAPGMVVRDGQVTLEGSVDPANRPELVLEAAVVAATKHARISRVALARLVERSPLPVEPWPESLRARFVDLLLCGHDAIGVIESLDHTGLWERYLPEWVTVRNRPQRNAYHRFTVDRHLLEAAANASQLVDRVERPDLLVVGSLLHDIAKGRPGDHTEVGMELIAEIGPRMGFDADDTAVLVDLCRHHLLLPDIATRRDISDQTTITMVANAVQDPVRLHLLAALTEADSLATGPAAWGSWKAELVRDLVRRVDHHFEGGAQASLSTIEFPDAQQRALMAQGETVVEAGGLTVTVITADRPGLFARVSGVLAIEGLEVRAADATAVDGMALEIFQVTSRFGSLIPWDRITDSLHAALEGRMAIEARLAARVRAYAPKASRPDLPPPVVRFDDAASTTATVVEVHARDRIGVLYKVSRAFAEFDLDVRTAKIQTMGDLIVDAFYVTHTDGTLLTDPDLRKELERSLLHAVT
ncbi:[protein-PII] uridylyltransferase [Aquihabitans daechungensis]|uniref:[protein-PII] uridylyltransferase n=1 Tax=Aquihabitans daechungensis TaxID=1052257 RepID=UPI003BA0C519